MHSIKSTIVTKDAESIIATACKDNAKRESKRVDFPNEDADSWQVDFIKQTDGTFMASVKNQHNVIVATAIVEGADQ